MKIVVRSMGEPEAMCNCSFPTSVNGRLHMGYLNGIWGDYMAIKINGVWVYPENLRRALVFRKLLGKGIDYAIRRESDNGHHGKTK